ncbi:MAG: four helix bundle protein [Syntrophaceae bacterium]
MAYASFEDLDVWKRACKLSVRVYQLLKDCREYGLKDQITRAGISIPSNIAEGAERGTNAEFMHFLHIAKGSAAELRTQLSIAREIGILESTVERELSGELKELSSMLHGLITSLKTPTKR